MSRPQPSPDINVSLTINGMHITVPKGTTILDAAKKVNVHIPTLCHHKDICKRAVCRLCVVECDGRVKLVTACANDVWEGVNIITNSQRLLETRKTILELILANHPKDCLKCAYNKKCKLQSLAMELGIYNSVSLFDHTAAHYPPSIEGETLVRDMSKCIKCTRCVEVCQAVQTIGAINTSARSREFGVCTPYNNTLKDSTCVFCGQCAAVCPVGAIYEHNQAAEVQNALNDGRQTVIAQITPELAAALNKEFYPAVEFGYSKAVKGNITAGKITAALRLLGFDKVFDASVAANVCISELNRELKERIKCNSIGSAKRLPMISGCSQGVYRFLKNFYPGFTANFTGQNPLNVFTGLIHNVFAEANGLAISNITLVSFTSCIAQKYRAGETGFALTAGELAGMIKLAGIDITALPEEQFDTINIDSRRCMNELYSRHESTLSNQAIEVQRETVRGFAQARKVLDTIQRGECNVQWIEIFCSGGCGKNGQE